MKASEDAGLTTALWEINPKYRGWLGLLPWLLGALAVFLLDGHATVQSMSMPLILAASVSALWWPGWLSVLGCAVASLWFNWFFITPRWSLSVSYQHDLLLLGSMLFTSLGVTWLMGRQRQLAEQFQRQANRIQQLHALSESLRSAENLPDALSALTRELEIMGYTLNGFCYPVAGTGSYEFSDGLSLLQQSGLKSCLIHSMSIGPGTGRHVDQQGWYLPIRSRYKSHASIHLFAHADADSRNDPLRPDDLLHLEALCHLTGDVIERHEAHQAAREAQAVIHDQQLRNQLLAAVSHDYRTPLACILSAATSLETQSAQLSPEQQKRLTQTIVNEVQQLDRLTDNALQLVRLEALRVDLHRDWQSAEELIGTVIGRARGRAPDRLWMVDIQPGLPLLMGDAILLVQLLENLVDNAIKYSPAHSPIQIGARSDAAQASMILTVCDQGPGLPEHVLVQAPLSAADDTARWIRPSPQTQAQRSSSRRGSGLGLSLCAAIAQAHEGSLRYRAMPDGGACVELWLPIESPPALDWPVEEARP